jgi:hypothetical protein
MVGEVIQIKSSTQYKSRQQSWDEKELQQGMHSTPIVTDATVGIATNLLHIMAGLVVSSLRWDSCSNLYLFSNLSH